MEYIIQERQSIANRRCRAWVPPEPDFSRRGLGRVTAFELECARATGGGLEEAKLPSCALRCCSRARLSSTLPPRFLVEAALAHYHDKLRRKVARRWHGRLLRALRHVAPHRRA
ncbi:unnamed protein product [Urochloa humidicola]